MATLDQLEKRISDFRLITTKRGMPKSISEHTDIVDARESLTAEVQAIRAAIRSRSTGVSKRVRALEDQVNQAWERLGDIEWLWADSVTDRHLKALDLLREESRFLLWTRWDEELRNLHRSTSEAVKAAADYDPSCSNTPAANRMQLAQRNFRRLEALKRRYRQILTAGGLMAADFVDGPAGKALAEAGIRIYEIMEMSPDKIEEIPGVGPKSREAICKVFLGHTGNLEASVAKAAEENGGNPTSLGARATITN